VTSGTGTFSPNDYNGRTRTYVPSDADYSRDSVILTATATELGIAAADILVIDFTHSLCLTYLLPYRHLRG